MSSQISDVARFHQQGDVRVKCDYQTASSRFLLCDEELNEVADAITSRDIASIIHEFTDLAYVAIGSCVQLVGPDASQLAWDEVHHANWDKVRLGVKKDPTTGKILKPANWKPANVNLVLSPHTPNIRLQLPGDYHLGIRSTDSWNSRLAKLAIESKEDLLDSDTISLSWDYSGVGAWQVKEFAEIPYTAKLLKAKVKELVAMRNLEEARASVRSLTEDSRR